MLSLDLLGVHAARLQGRFRVRVCLSGEFDPGPHSIHSRGQRIDLARPGDDGPEGVVGGEIAIDFRGLHVELSKGSTGCRLS